MLNLKGFVSYHNVHYVNFFVGLHAHQG